MREPDVDNVVITERPNGWWVTVERTEGGKEHHGPYLDRELAEIEARTFSDEVQFAIADPPERHVG